ncbi:MAG TPA: polyphenol oxidase family protein [Gaiellaceae bacterium]|nr:polyphenol oxidase family protein [Gaiellaceae bacterium]
MIFRWEAPGPYRVAFSTREGGVSEGAYASLNLGLLTKDEPANVEENRRRLCAEIDADPALLALNRQVHGTTVRRASAGDRHERADGLWTDKAGVPMLAMTADCVPVALVRTNGDTPGLAILHVGWRGLADGVIASGVEALGGRPAAAIGPAIGPCCYEIGREVAALFDADLVRGRKLDLWTAVERTLQAAGVQEVERTDVCTSCHPELFFSHRRDEGVTGRQGVIGVVG